MNSLDHADFEWNGHFWKAIVRLDCWARFQSRRGPYASRDQDAPSDGTVNLVFLRGGRDDSPLLSSELELLNWVFDNSAAIQKSLLPALLSEYPSIREEYADCVETPEQLPPLSEPIGLASVIGLNSIHVHPIRKDGLPYAGFEFGCNWDEEHGLGALMHGTSVVKLGGADTAFLRWMAKQHMQGEQV